MLGLRAQKMWEAAQTAASWQMVPIPLTGKVPRLYHWEQTSLQQALPQFWQYISTNRNLEQLNIGVLTGAPSNITVVDIDARNGGMERWTQLLQGHEMPETLAVQTGSKDYCTETTCYVGGLHFYFQYVPDLPNVPSMAGIELLNTGKQVVFPPSLHPNTGRPYQFLSGIRENGIILAPMPLWLQNYFRQL